MLGYYCQRVWDVFSIFYSKGIQEAIWFDVPASEGVLAPYFPHGSAKSFLIGKFAR